MVRDEYVTRTGRGSTVEFAITEKGRQRCALPDPTAHWDRTWDNCWRLFTFDIPESRRKDRLTLWRELRSRRLGFLQLSVWISPHDIEAVLNEVVEAHGIPECFAGFECDRLFLCSHAEIVSTAWDFEKIALEQEAYLRQIVGITSGLRGATNLPTLARLARAERLSYEDAMAHDPWLPRVLWPKGYRGEKVHRAHQAVRTELSRRLPQLVREGKVNSGRYDRFT